MYRLMVKTHNQTGLKYLCITTKDDYEKYTGSGVYWTRHLKVHGYDFTTEVLYESEDKSEEFIATCKEYSKKFDIVNSKDWANLVIENGNDGSLNFIPSDEQRKKAGASLKQHYIDNPEKGKAISNKLKQYYSDNPEARERQRHKFLNWLETPENREKFVDAIQQEHARRKQNPEFLAEIGRKISKTKLAWSEERRKEIYDKVKETKKSSESWENFVDDMKVKRQGEGNPNARGCVFEGVEYETMTEFREYIKSTDISLYTAFSMLDDPENLTCYRLYTPKKRNMIKCHNCGKEGKDSSAFKRWHFDNCKHKK